MMPQDEIIDRGVSIPDYPRGSILRGFGCSAMLHAVVIIAIVLGLLASPSVRSPNPQRIILVNLVQLAETNTSPASPDKARIPQQRATEQATVSAPAAVPVAWRKSGLCRHLAPPRRRRCQSRLPAADGDSRRWRDSPTNALSARLEQLSRLQQPAPQLPPAPRDQVGSGLSNISVASDGAKPGAEATYRVKDFLRAQVERRWYVELGGLTPDRSKVSIHILLDPDGTVSSAEVVDDASHRNDPAYEAFAASARNAVLLSSPLTLLPGQLTPSPRTSSSTSMRGVSIR